MLINDEKRNRIKRTVIVTVLFASALAAYLAVYLSLHIGIPCVFNVVTGFNCPGCGTTRSIAALLRFDLAAALGYNAFVFPSLIYIAGLYFHSAYQYVKNGKHRVSFPVKYVDTIYLVLLVFWWVFRNIVKM